MMAILNSVIPSSSFGMLRGQIHNSFMLLNYLACATKQQILLECQYNLLSESQSTLTLPVLWLACMQVKSFACGQVSKLFEIFN